MSSTPPSLGFALADQQPIPVPLFAFFDWASGTEPEGDPRDFFALQVNGKVPSDHLAADPDFTAFAPSGPTLKVAFESLYAQYVAATLASAPYRLPTCDCRLARGQVFLSLHYRCWRISHGSFLLDPPGVFS